MGNPRKPARIKRWRGSWYLWYTDPTTGKAMRVACSSLEAHDEGQRASLLTTWRLQEQAYHAERVLYGRGIAFDTPLLSAIDDFMANIASRVKLREALPDSREGITAKSSLGYESCIRKAFRPWVQATHPTLTTGQLDVSTLNSFLGWVATTPAGNGRSRGPVAMNTFRTHVGAFVNWMAEKRPRLLPDPDPLRKACRHVRVPARNLKAYTPGQLREFAGVLPPRCVKLFELLRGTGLRLSEALRLGWDNIDLKAGLVIVNATKTGKLRFIPLKETAPKLLKAMKRWSKAEPPCGVVSTKTGEPFYPKKEWEQAARASAWITPQGIRRTFLSVCIARGVPAAIASGWLGHGIAIMEKFYLMQIPGKRPTSIETGMGS